MEAALTTLLAPVAGGRRFWVKAPSNYPTPETRLVRPYVVLTRVGGVRNYHFTGPSGYVESRVQIDCYGDTYDSVKSVASAILAILSGYSGGDIQAIFVEGERDLPAADTGEVNELFRKKLDLIVHHGE
jgi:hypothetical protein